MYWARHWTNYSGKKNKTKQTAHHAPMSFGHRPVKEDVAQTMKKAGDRKDDKATGLCLHKGRSFSSDRTATAVNCQRQFNPA